MPFGHSSSLPPAISPPPVANSDSVGAFPLPCAGCRARHHASTPRHAQLEGNGAGRRTAPMGSFATAATSSREHLWLDALNGSDPDLVPPHGSGRTLVTSLTPSSFSEAPTAASPAGCSGLARVERSRSHKNSAIQDDAQSVVSDTSVAASAPRHE